MRTFTLLLILILATPIVISQQSLKDKEKMIQKGINRYYHFNIYSNNTLYFLNNTRYNQYSQTFTGTISSVDSSSNAMNYPLGEKEIQIRVEAMNVSSVYIAIELKDILSIRQAEY